MVLRVEPQNCSADFNLLQPGDAISHHKPWLSLVSSNDLYILWQVISCASAELLHKEQIPANKLYNQYVIITLTRHFNMMIMYSLHTMFARIAVKFELKYNHFCSINCTLKCKMAAIFFRPQCVNYGIFVSIDYALMITPHTLNMNGVIILLSSFPCSGWVWPNSMPSLDPEDSSTIPLNSLNDRKFACL